MTQVLYVHMCTPARVLKHAKETANVSKLQLAKHLYANVNIDVISNFSLTKSDSSNDALRFIYCVSFPAAYYCLTVCDHWISVIVCRIIFSY